MLGTGIHLTGRTRLALAVAMVASTLLPAYTLAHRLRADGARQHGETASHDQGVAHHDYRSGPAEAGSPRHAGTSDPCSEVIKAMGQRVPNRLHAVGLGDDDVPVAVLDRYRIGGMHCMSDDLAGRVDAVMVNFLDVAGDITALWLVTRTDEQRPVRWEEYLRSYYAESLQARGVPASQIPAPAQVARSGGSVVLVAAGKEATRIRAVLTTGSRAAKASLWEHVAHQIGPDRPG